ncbi:hypothetical protein OHV05_00745 [Kitasatospora sp. NBC_00070]|uniref:hypothetical protein n=1 Tax=Kitasatospora sp. NBC_00070 TaxID=2975962 RepID=UPI003246CBFC
MANHQQQASPYVPIPGTDQLTRALTEFGEAPDAAAGLSAVQLAGRLAGSADVAVLVLAVDPQTREDHMPDWIRGYGQAVCGRTETFSEEKDRYLLVLALRIGMSSALLGTEARHGEGSGRGGNSCGVGGCRPGQALCLGVDLARWALAALSAAAASPDSAAGGPVAGGQQPLSARLQDDKPAVLEADPITDGQEERSSWLEGVAVVGLKVLDQHQPRGRCGPISNQAHAEMLPRGAAPRQANPEGRQAGGQGTSSAPVPDAAMK